MEPVITSDLDVVFEAEPNSVLDMESFSYCIDELSSKLSELEQGVNVVEQFCLSSDSKQPKCRSIAKDKVREKYLANIENQQRHGLQRAATAEKRTQELMRQFSGIFNQITQHKWSSPFMQPVDVERLGLHDYYKVIEKPMDLGTIKSKMQAKDGAGYKNVREIYADVRLVFKNAMKYNDERDDTHVMARTLLEKLEEKWLQLLPKVVEEENRKAKDEAATQVALKLAEEATHADMARDLSNQLCEVDLKLENLRAMVVQKCRKMSVEDKKKLGRALTQLSPEDLTRALEIVADDNPSFQATAREVDLDMDSQSDSTLWRLRVFVKDALKAMAQKSGENVNNHKSKNTGAAAAANNNKRRREISDGITNTSARKTRRISLIP